MSKRVLAVLFVLILGGVYVVRAQQRPTAAPSSAAKQAEQAGPPSYTYQAEYYGFITSSTELRRGHNITPDEVKKSVAAGGRYVLLGSPLGRREIEPQEKAAPFAGQQVFMTLSVTTQRYGTGPTSDPSIAGYAAGGDRPVTRVDTYTIVAIKPTVYDDAWKNAPDFIWRGRPPQGVR